MKLSLKAFFKIFSRTGVLYLAMILLIVGLVDYRKVQLKILDELRLPLDVLLDFSSGKGSLSRENLEAQTSYYEKAHAVVPKNDEINSLLGFCQYYSGQKAAAMASLKQAAEARPYFFWYTYNLGLVSFLAGDFSAAVECFQKALNANMEVTEEIALQSMVYRNSEELYNGSLLDGKRRLTPLAWIQKGIRAGRETAYKLMILSHERLGQYEEMVRAAQFALVSPQIEDKAWFYNYLGRAASHLRSFPLAINAFEQSLKLAPQASENYQGLGDCFAARNNRAAAEAFWQKAKDFSRQSETFLTVESARNLRLKIF